MLISRLANGLVCLLVIAMISSCASRSTKPPQESISEPKDISSENLRQVRADEEAKLRDIERELEQGLQDGDFTALERSLRDINVDVLDDNQRLRRQIAIIRFYLLRNNPGIARRYIEAVNDNFLVKVERETQRNWFLVYADVLEATGEPHNALRFRLLLDERLTAAESADNHPTVLRLLGQMSMEDLLLEAQLAPDLYIRGWYDFGILFKLDPDTSRLDALQHWRQSYPRHPGQRYFGHLANYHDNLPPLNRFDRVAFLLPFSGNLAGISNAIYNGYEDMAQNTAWQPLKLDTTEDTIPFLLAEASTQGVELIIGPLRKDKVEEATIVSEQLSIPMIALNELPPEPPTHVYNLALSLEHSADFAVDMAWNDLCRWAVLLVDDTNLGLRIAQRIQEGWDAKGGVLVKTSFIDQRTNLVDQISDFLEVDAAEIEATKEVYRRYLLLLGQLGWSGDEIDDILGNRGQSSNIPFVMPRDDKRLLLRDEEIVWLQERYYEKNFAIEANITRLLPPKDASQSDADYYSQFNPEQLLTLFQQQMEDAYDRVEADCIFLAMERSAATSVRPYFSFFLSNDIPVYGTFLLLDAGLLTSTYEDLHQVGYGEMPWLSDLVRDPNARASAGDSSVNELRYYAVGRDAFLVAQSLTRMDTIQPFFLLGHSGMLQLTDDKQFVQRPRAVLFNRGLPRPLPRKSAFE